MDAYFEPDSADDFEPTALPTMALSDGGKVATTQAGPLEVQYDAEISIGELGELSRLATLVARHREAMSAILDEAEPTLKIDLAELPPRAIAADGKQPGLTWSVTLFNSAADDGNSFARSRLAFMYLHGLGVAKDAARSRALALSAAENNEPFAIYQLARMAERRGGADGQTEAVGWYEKLSISIRTWFQSTWLGTSPQTLLIANRLLTPGGALSSPAGTAALARVAAGSPDFARALGDVNLCTICGGTIDVAEAAKWLRLASDNGNQPAGYTLSGLLRKWPDLATSAGEPVARLARNIEAAEDDTRLFGYNTDIASYLTLQLEQGPVNEDAAAVARRMAGVLDTVCTKQPDDCESAAHLIASGRIDVRLVADGIERLKALHSAYLVDILAEYGDFKGALALAQSLDQHDLDLNSTLFDGSVNQPSAIIRRIIAGRWLEDMPKVPDGLVPLPFTFLAAHDDHEAASSCSTCSARRARRSHRHPLLRPKRSEATRREAVAALGGLSRTMVNSARDLSLALQRDGRREEALRMELTALSAELQLDDVSGLSTGPLQVSLTRVCHLSKASERAFALGSDHVAIVPQGCGTRTLQKVRADLSNVPEELQTCFRDLVADNYRWLADLFIRQGRLGEAEFVLGLLKDFEAFQFVERDTDFVGRSYEDLPYSAPEQALKDAFDALRPPTTFDARRAEELRTERASSSLSPEETAELAAIEARLAAADAAYDKAMDRSWRRPMSWPQRPRRHSPRSDRCRAICGPRSTSRRWRCTIWSTRPPDHPDDGQRPQELHLDGWEGNTFSEAKLEMRIAAFHDDLSNPGKDPRPRAKRLYDLLLAPFVNDIAAIDTRLVLVSLDRRLRYLPFAALYDGEKYAVQHFDIAMLSDAGYEISGHKVTGAPVAALGTTQAVAGFAALPGVGIELDGIIKGADGFGLFDGKVELDKDFDRTALETRCASAQPRRPVSASSTSPRISRSARPIPARSSCSAPVTR